MGFLGEGDGQEWRCDKGLTRGLGFLHDTMWCWVIRLWSIDRNGVLAYCTWIFNYYDCHRLIWTLISRAIYVTRLETRDSTSFIN